MSDVLQPGLLARRVVLRRALGAGVGGADRGGAACGRAGG